MKILSCWDGTWVPRNKIIRFKLLDLEEVQYDGANVKYGIIIELTDNKFSILYANKEKEKVENFMFNLISDWDNE